MPSNHRRPLAARRAVAELMILTGAVLAVGACGSQEAGVAVPSTTVSSSPGGSTGSSTPTSSTPAARTDTAGGAVSGDVDDIVPFDDPATQLESADDLVDYLLPGLSGDGVECTRDRLDAEAILASPDPDDAARVVEAVTGCVERSSIGVVFAMYAVGFAEDGATVFPEVADCSRAAVGTHRNRDVREALESLYSARLDLLGPPTSRVVAADYLQETTECLAGSSSTSPGPTTTVDTPTSSPTSSPAGTPTPGSSGMLRSVRWNLLQPGDCLPAYPEGNVVQVGVVGCDQPHVAEVVGAGFLTATEAENGCRNLFRNYTGQDVESSASVLDILEAAEPGGSARVVCLASPASGELVTGSVKQTP